VNRPGLAGTIAVANKTAEMLIDAMAARRLLVAVMTRFPLDLALRRRGWG